MIYGVFGLPGGFQFIPTTIESRHKQIHNQTSKIMVFMVRVTVSYYPKLPLNS